MFPTSRIFLTIGSFGAGPAFYGKETFQYINAFGMFHLSRTKVQQEAKLCGQDSIEKAFIHKLYCSTISIKQ